VLPAAPLPARAPEGPGLATILTLRPFQCKWPMSGEGEDMTFCGRQMDRQPYCEFHALRAYQAPTAKRSEKELVRSVRR
jgi:GcrA cell cycle regulator